MYPDNILPKLSMLSAILKHKQDEDRLQNGFFFAIPDAPRNIRNNQGISFDRLKFVMGGLKVS